MDHRPFRELAAGAAIGDLTTGERLRFRVHAALCPDCAAVERDLGGTLATLSLAPRQRPVPDGLRAGVLASIATAGSTADVDRLLRENRRLRTLSIAGIGAAAVLALAVAGVGLRAATLSDEIAATDASLATMASRISAGEAAMAVSLAPGHVTAPLGAMPAAPDAEATIIYLPGSTDAYLVARSLPAAPAGHVYQLWVADGAGVHALGTFAYDGTGVLVAPFGTDLAGMTAAMLTLEPAGGATGAPGPELLFGEL
jgi:hypothetical protein